MHDHLLSGTASLANPRLISQTDDVKAFEVKAQGFGWFEKKYRVTHNTQNHTLAVTRLYGCGIAAARVPLDYQPGWLRQHRTSQWIVKLFLSRGEAISDEDKAKILVQPALEDHSIRLLDWMSDGELTGELPRLGISCQRQPTGEALTCQKTQVVFDAMLAHGAEQACKILKQKSAEFQVSVLKHQLDRHTQSQEKRQLQLILQCLLEQDERAVQELFQVLIEEVKRDFNKHKILAVIVKAFIASNPALLAHKLQTTANQKLQLVLLSASIPPQPEGLSKFYSELCNLTGFSHNMRLAQRAIVDFSNERELTTYEHDDEVSRSDYKWLFSQNDATTSSIRVLHLILSSDCLYAMLKARCSFFGLQLHRENKIIAATCARGYEEQWGILNSCLHADGELSAFYTRLINNLLTASNPEFPGISAVLFAGEDFDLFWALYDKGCSQAWRVLLAQPLEIQARCLEPVLLAKETSSEQYNFAKQLILKSKYATSIFMRKVCKSNDSIRRNIPALIEKDTDFAIECLSTQGAITQAQVIDLIIEGSVNLNGNTLTFVQAILRTNNDKFEGICRYFTNGTGLNRIIGKLVDADADPDFAKTFLLHLDCAAQTRWVIDTMSKVRGNNAICVMALLSNENRKCSALMEQLNVAGLLGQLQGILAVKRFHFRLGLSI